MAKLVRTPSLDNRKPGPGHVFSSSADNKICNYNTSIGNIVNILCSKYMSQNNKSSPSSP